MSELDLLSFISVRDVEVDDGAHTSLRHKGDGFKSLFAMAILQFVAKQRYGKNLIFGVEEPESHLHSTAIYELKNALRELSNSFQVLLTTHSPILIQRDDIRNNIVVEQISGPDFSSTAKPARTLAHIRRSLGIRPQDNMSTAEVVLVAEGATEEVVLPSLLVRSVSTLEEAFRGGRVRVVSAGSAASVLSVVRALARDAAHCVIFLDSDIEGDNAAKKIGDSGLLSSADIFQVPRREGCVETEFEDIFEPTLYVEEVADACGVSLSAVEFEKIRQRSGSSKTRVAKWSQVMKKAMEERGKDWSSVNNVAKEALASAVTKRADEVANAHLIWVRSVGKRINQYLSEEE